MAGPEGIGDVAVILAALVLIADQQGDRRTGRLAFEYTGENLDGIRLAALRDVTGGARLATIQFGLDIRLADFQPGRATVDHAADGRTMGFAKGRDGEKRAKSVTGHGK